MVVGVALKEGPEAVREFARDLGIDFPLWLDPTGRTPQAFGLWGHPTTVLIDRQGRVVGRIRGERDWTTDAAGRLIEVLLDGAGTRR